MSEKTVKRFMKEPLVQFMIIGALIFAVDACVSRYAEDINKITIDDARLGQLIEIFRLGQGRAPSAQEVDNMIVKWTQNEILFREAKKIGLDRGDEMIRSRLVLKMQNVLFNNVTFEVPPKEELKQWFEEYKDNYNRPARFTMEQFFLGSVSDMDLGTANELARTLGSQTPAEPYANKLRKYPLRPAASLTSIFAEDDIAQLSQTPLNQWQVVTSANGLHLARFTDKIDAEVAVFEDHEIQIVKDWKQYANQLQLMQQTTEIANRYTIDITANKSLSVNAENSEEIDDGERNNAPSDQDDAGGSTGV
jgi:hypothetical protein